jgi:hypothetical protein
LYVLLSAVVSTTPVLLYVMDVTRLLYVTEMGRRKGGGAGEGGGQVPHETGQFWRAAGWEGHAVLKALPGANEEHGTGLLSVSLTPLLIWSEHKGGGGGGPVTSRVLEPSFTRTAPLCSASYIVLYPCAHTSSAPLYLESSL